MHNFSRMNPTSLLALLGSVVPLLSCGILFCTDSTALNLLAIKQLSLVILAFFETDGAAGIAITSVVVYSSLLFSYFTCTRVTQQRKLPQIVFPLLFAGVVVLQILCGLGALFIAALALSVYFYASVLLTSARYLRTSSLRKDVALSKLLNAVFRSFLYMSIDLLAALTFFYYLPSPSGSWFVAIYPNYIHNIAIAAITLLFPTNEIQHTLTKLKLRKSSSRIERD